MNTMKILRALLIVSLLAFGALASPARAGANDPLFVNLTSDDSHRANMAITFGRNQFERGHPLAIFLNDRAVAIASTANTARFAAHQRALAALIEKGAVVMVCPMCMAHYGVREADLMPGVKVGNPALTGEALFRDGGKALTW